jgi:ABC-type nitrate/sulfonate/bicarbonate transport system substrate-binding protein
MSVAVDTPTPAVAPGTAPVEKLWYTRCPVPTASGIAQHYRWLHAAFQPLNIELDSIRASQDKDVRESHFRHNLPGSFREGGNVPPIWTRSRGQNTAVVAITWVDEAQLILVHPDSPVRSVADLRGRKLGLVRNENVDLVDVLRAESLRGLLTALKIHGVERHEVQWTDIPSQAWELREQTSSRETRRHPLVEALLAGSVDAVFIKGASTAAALARGLRPIFNINEQQDPLLRVSAGSPRPVTVDRETLQRHPQLVARYLAVLLKTAAWAKQHPDEVVAAIAAETGVGAEAVRQAFGPKLHLSFEPQLSPTYLQGLRSQKDFLLAEGFIPVDFDFDAWIHYSVLTQARALAEQIELPVAADRAQVA